MIARHYTYAAYFVDGPLDLTKRDVVAAEPWYCTKTFDPDTGETERVEYRLAYRHEDPDRRILIYIWEQ